MWRKRWGCDEDAEQPFAYVRCHVCYGEDPKCKTCDGYLYGIKITRCPFQTIDRTTSVVLRYYGDWKDGRMFLAGGVSDQPAALVEGFRYLDGYVGQFMADEHDKQKQQMEHASRQK